MIGLSGACFLRDLDVFCGPPAFLSSTNEFDLRVAGLPEKSGYR
jgi:hypothetical protein